MERLTLHFVSAAQEAGPVLYEVEDLVQRRWCPLPRHHVTKRLHRPQAHPTGTLTKIRAVTSSTATALRDQHFLEIRNDR